ncbi:hypothetical protein BKA59DRAFT_389484 [Fusarium tricinctum]|uniref:Polyketide synthase n=1 Tax=Fusarium tricinctum TaxID=61284 RepID=A0A8K0S3G4_9HYPO|nr:hypothetical protein BKA59DRAFT_389484 [Fusarium tricinctum]
MSPEVSLDGRHEPVSIVGMGCRWAGGVRDPPGLWQLLRNNQDGWREFQEPHFSTRGFHHDNPNRLGSMRTRGGFLIDEDARLFDPSVFGITGREVETMDPSQRKLLEVVYEAFESAGESLESIDGSRTGVYIGNFAFDHLLIQARDWENPKSYAATGADTSILANRISYIFNLHGPSLATNTACSSSMYALHMAVSAIRNGDCDGAIVAAANWITDPSMQIVLDKLGALSPTSRCHTFDASADGYARGEGFGALYLKKSSVAISEGLPIRAMIRGTAVNANGRTGGITRPSATGQEEVIRKAYENAGGLPFTDTTFFECHGTGTQAGDPLEVSAVGNVFASERSDTPEDALLIGSIKPSLGHTEGASAIASIMKIVLSLEAGEIPPTFGVTNLNPMIDFDKAKVRVVKDRTIEWPEGKLRRASVNSFGFGGANGHCIIDHVNVVLPDYKKPVSISTASNHLPRPSTNGHMNGSTNGHTNGNGSGPRKHSPIINGPKMIPTIDAPTRKLVLLPFSAHSPPSLQSNIDALADVINKWSLADVAYTLGAKRSRLQHRCFRVVDKDSVADGLKTRSPVFQSPTKTIKVGFVFTGQGAQWHGMGAQLFQYHVFRDTIGYLDHVLHHLRTPVPWTIFDMLSGNSKEVDMQSPEVSQVACTALQIGLVDLLASWSVRPAAAVGHSSGEMAAAYASGRITAAECITAAFFRGQAVSKNTQRGTMLAVGLGPDLAAEYIKDREDQIKVGAINSPRSVTLSGDAAAIEELSTLLTKDGVFNRLLRTGNNAYHSHHMEALGTDFCDMLSDGIETIAKMGLVDNNQRYPAVPWVSSVTPDKALGLSDANPSYWKTNLESPVRFSQAVTKLMDTEAFDAMIEIGPHPALKGPVDQILKSLGNPCQYLASIIRSEDAAISMLQLAGSLFSLNAEINLAAVNSVDVVSGNGTTSLIHGCTVVDLPIYQYTYGPVNYYESRASQDYRLRNILRHDILGSKIPGVAKLQPQWQNVLRVKDVPWIADHRLIPDAVFPAAGFIAMAVEAAKRVHQESPISAPITGYSLRRVDVKAALRVPEDDTGIEVILSMDLGSSATPKTLEWTKFTIVSVARDSSKWTEHCTGQVKVEAGLTVNMNSIGTEMDSRTTDISAWYNRFAEIGIGYGPAFQVLSDVRADPHKNTVIATVQLDRTAATIEGGESDYPVHPITLDAAFQLGLISCYGGQLERANTAYVPVHISHMRLNATKAGPSHGTITAQGRTQGLRSAYVRSQVCDANGNVIVEVDTLRCISYKESKSAKQLASAIPFNSPFARLSWKPDLRKLSNEQARSLFPPPSENNAGQMGLETADMICCLVVAEIYEQLGNDMATWPHPKGELGHWLSWIRKCVEEDERPNMVEARQLPSNERRHLLQSLYEEAGDKPEARAAKALHENIMDILHERKTGIEVLVSEGLLTALYEVGHMVAGSHPQLYSLLDSMGHANPNLRILEIGGGTGAATRVAMKALSGPNGIKRYADYTFTDVSAGFITFAKDFMSEYHDIHYSVLDIDTNPLEHGYKPEYDVVIACEAIHATPSMDRTLSNCRSLLKPGGKLVLVETVRMRVLAGLLYGTLTGYWLGASDDRTEGPFMNVETWDSRLRSAGFSGTDIVLDDYDYPHTTTSVLVSTRLEGHADTNGVNDLGNGSTQIYLLHDDKGAPPLLQEISTALERRGAVVNIAPIDETPGDLNSSSRVVVFLCPQNDLFEADDSRFGLFQRLVRGAHSMVWVTSSGIIRGRDPRGAFMIGLLRVIATENPAGRFLSIDIDSQNFDTRDEALVRSIVDVEESLQHEEPDQHNDHEYVWQDGALWISRFVPDAELNTYADNPESIGMQETEIASLAGQGPLRASFETAGLLSSLYFRPYTELLNSLQDDYIDVKVAAVGLNWKDLALATGKFDGVSNDLSSEYAGIITKVGANVTELSVGDRVYGVGRGHFGNYTRVPAAFACKLQPGDNSVEMATMPLVYMTAVYALERIAHLRRGQKILIQSATGGLGLAAIQLARYKHADVFVTAGTTDKIDFLKNSMGFQADRVFASRDPLALAQASQKTGKNGFDVILCTASGGDLLHASLAALAPMGHLIDLSRVDVIESRDIGLDVFQRNASFTSFDLNLILDNDTELGSQLMKTVDELYRAGSIGPIHPFTVCDISHLDEVMLRFSKGAHIGKHVISFENPDSTIKLTKQPPRASFDPSARYVVVGGFGGLGRAIILWMVERGARSFIVFSRRGVRTPEARILVRDLAARGIHLDVVPCDVSSQGEVEEAFKKVSEASHPIKGVIHAALFLSDLSFDKLTAAKWEKGIEAKTLGTINLHKATESLPLDFFLMITSTESVWAPATQAAYIAATNFQESFSRYRRSLGLPASAVALGLVKDIMSDFKDGSFGTEEMYARNQALTMTGYQVLSQLEPAFLNQLPSHWIGAKDDPLSAASLFTCLNPLALAKLPSPQTPRWHSDPRVSLIVHAMNDARRHALSDEENGAGNGDNGGAASASAVAGLRRAFSEAIKQGEEARSSTVTLVMDGITKTIAEMLFIDVLNVNPERSIAEHGVDSLIAAELRHWFHQALGADLQMQDLLDAQASIKVLSASIVDKALTKEDGQ